MSEMKYEYAHATSDGEYWGLINRSGKYIVKAEYVSIHQWKEGMLRLTKKASDVIVQDDVWVNKYNGQVHYVNYEGESINSNPYDYGLDFSEGLAAVVRDGKWGFISRDGKVAIEFQFQMTYSFHQGLSSTKQENKWGFIDKEGNWAIEPVYDSAQSFAFGLAVVEEAGTYLIIDKSAKVITKVPDGYTWVVVKSENIILYGTTSGDIGIRYYGFMNIDGDILSEPIFYMESEYHFDLFHYSDGMLIVTNEEDQYGYLNEKGQLTIPCLYDTAAPFVNDYAIVTLNGQKYSLDKNGELSEIEEQAYSFDEVMTFHEGLAAARKGDRWGFINKAGEVIIDFIYNEYPSSKAGIPAGVYLAEIFPKFSCGLLPILRSDGNNCLSGFIDTLGKEVIPTKFLFVRGFEEVKPDGHH